MAERPSCRSRLAKLWRQSAYAVGSTPTVEDLGTAADTGSLWRLGGTTPRGFRRGALRRETQPEREPHVRWKDGDTGGARRHRRGRVGRVHGRAVVGNRGHEA